MATSVLSAVAGPLSDALRAEGYLPGEWAPTPAKGQTFEVRTVQWVAPFRDPATNVRFLATVRLFVVNAGGFHRASAWVDMCRVGEVRSDPDSVCQSVCDVIWGSLSHAGACDAFEAQMTTWQLPANAPALAVRAGELVADLTAILTP